MLLISWREAESNLRKGYAPISEDIGRANPVPVSPHVSEIRRQDPLKNVASVPSKLSKNGNESSHVCGNVYVCQVK
jgi:hypothetical protein